MAFSKKTWLARLGEGLNKFRMRITGTSPGGDEIAEMHPAPDSITQQGDGFTVNNMNDLEGRIYDAFRALPASFKLNNSAKSGDDAYEAYAPTSYGATGRLLIGGGTNAAPVWMSSNGLTNRILRSQGSGSSPTWDNLMTLNGSNVNTASIYAPTTSGTSGQCLLSKGANQAPEWGAAKGSIDPTSNMYIKYQSSTTNVWNGVNSYLSISSGSKTDTLYHQYTVIGHVTYNSTNYKLVWLKLYWCASSQSWARSAKSYPGAFAKIFSIWSTNYAGYGTNVQGGRTKISSYSTSSVTTGENDTEVGTAIDVVGISSSTYYSE